MDDTMILQSATMTVPQYWLSKGLMYLMFNVTWLEIHLFKS